MKIFTVGLIGFIVFGIVGLYIYHGTYTRESYDIRECSKKYQFLNLTTPRDASLAFASIFDPRGYVQLTILFVYPTNELQERGFLGSLYSEATNDPEVFLNYEEKNTDDAVVLLKKIPSPSKGEEPIYCVVSKEEVSVVDLLNNPDTFSIGLQWKHPKRNLLSTEHTRGVISRGLPYHY